MGRFYFAGPSYGQIDKITGIMIKYQRTPFLLVSLFCFYKTDAYTVRVKFVGKDGGFYQESPTCISGRGGRPDHDLERTARDHQVPDRLMPVEQLGSRRAVLFCQFTFGSAWACTT